MTDARVILIAGPTAGGKSAAALELAARLDGEIVNADAMQVYRDLRFLTARPSPADEQKAPHHLFGFVDASDAFSAGRWARAAAAALEEITERGRRVIIVGGTGLYFKALEEGLSPIPEIPSSVREKARARREAIGAAAFRDEVIARDEQMARLPEGDAQRLLRAWEVYEATGEPLSAFQAAPRQPLLTEKALRAVLAPAREDLYARCEARAEAMLCEGGIEEARTLLARRLDPALPAMKALGVPECAAFLRGDLSREDALQELQKNTRRFAKRQMTWFRGQTADWPVFEDAPTLIEALTP